MITCRGKALILMVCTVLLLINARAEAQVRGEISRPGSVLVPVSVPGLEWGGGETRPAAAARFNKLLAEDLRRSGIFNVVDPPRGLGLPSSDGYGGWSAAGVLGVVGGSYTGTPGGITVEVRFLTWPRDAAWVDVVSTDRWTRCRQWPTRSPTVSWR